MGERWCCDGLKFSFSERRERGIFVFAEPPSETRNDAAFFIAMRSVEADRLEELRAVELPRDLPLTIATRRPIKHCPWCGCRLARFYRRRFQQLVDETLSDEFDHRPDPQPRGGIE